MSRPRGVIAARGVRAPRWSRHAHRCDNCGSAELLKVPLIPSDHSHLWVGEGVMHNIPISRYVCTDCGCIGEWANNKEDLAKLKADYLRNAGRK